MREMLDVVVARPALRDAVYVGKSPIVKAFFENLRVTCADVSLLHVAQTGSRRVPGTFAQICYGKSTLVDARLRSRIPFECVRPVVDEYSIPFRVPNAYPQQKGAKAALEFVCATEIYSCDVGASDCLMPRELEVHIHALVRVEVNISLRLRAESSRRRLHAVDATSARWRRGACPSLVDFVHRR